MGYRTGGSGREIDNKQEEVEVEREGESGGRIRIKSRKKWK